MRRLAYTCAIIASGLFASTLAAQQEDSVPERPFVAGGIYDKPYLGRLFGRAAIGGYAEAHFRYGRVDGTTDELRFVPKRFNLFTFAQVSDFIQLAAELEFEDGTEEILLEFAVIDFTIHRAITFRGGQLLVPLGRFNLSHDSPINEFTDRPIEAEDIIGVALSMPGFGLLGQFPIGRRSRITYEVYAINGYDEGVIGDSEDGTFIPNGKQNIENENKKLAGVGRVSFSPNLGWELGLSGYAGAYNSSEEDGLVVAEDQYITMAVLDFEALPLGIRLSGEGTLASVDIPQSLQATFASRQAGVYIDALWDFGRAWIKTMPRSYFTVGARWDYADFDRDRPGRDINQITLGANFRPTSDTVFKLNYVRGREHDEFNNAADLARILFSVATYF